MPNFAQHWSRFPCVQTRKRGLSHCVAPAGQPPANAEVKSRSGNCSYSKNSNLRIDDDDSRDRATKRLSGPLTLLVRLIISTRERGTLFSTPERWVFTASGSALSLNA